MLHLENFFEKSFALLLTTPNSKKIKHKHCKKNIENGILKESLRAKK